MIALVLAAALTGAAEATPDGIQDVLWQRLDATVTHEAETLDGVLGVALLDLTSGRTLARNADLVFPTASTIKAAVLVELYRQDEKGAGAHLDDVYVPNPKDVVESTRILGGLSPGTRLTNRDLARIMIAVSDNSATNVLIDRVGMARVNDLLASQGLTATRLRRKMLDLAAARDGRENTATPRELMRFFEALYRGRLLGPKATGEVLDTLSVIKRDHFRLSEDERVANKPGELPGVRTDAGIVYAASPFVLVVMTTADADERAAEDAIGRIAAAAYATLDRVGRMSPYGRLAPPSPAP